MSHESNDDLNERKAIVRDFLERCRQWAQTKEIPKRTQRVAHAPNSADAAKLHAWIAYDAFLDHTLEELADGTLDHWFRNEVPEYNRSEGEP